MPRERSSPATRRAGSLDKLNEALRTEDDGGVDADDAPMQIDQRSARGAGIPHTVPAHGAADRRDDARGHRRLEAERVADGDDELPHAELRREAELGVCERATGAQDGQVRRRIGTDELRLVTADIDRRDAKALAVLDPMRVREDVVTWRRPSPSACSCRAAPRRESTTLDTTADPMRLTTEVTAREYASGHRPR